MTHNPLKKEVLPWNKNGLKVMIFVKNNKQEQAWWTSPRCCRQGWRNYSRSRYANWKKYSVREGSSQAEVELESQQEEKIETPEDGEARTEIEEKKASYSTEEESDLPSETEKSL